jgi:outer membrane protein OmpA-like peptidoglycan-associated protein
MLPLLFILAGNFVYTERELFDCRKKTNYAMRILLTGAFVLLLWLGAGAWWHTCVNKCLCGSPDVSVAALSDQAAPPAIAKEESSGPATPENDALPADTLPVVKKDTVAKVKTPPVKKEESIKDRTLYVDFGRYKFDPDAGIGTYADELKAYLEAHPGTEVNITGHTDDTGSEATNLRFGKSRARSVQKFFVGKGIPSSRLKVFSKGESEPVGDNTTEEGRALNRRIHVVIVTPTN